MLLIPYHDRVQGAVRRILASRQWTEIQKRWLKRIGEQLEREIVVDRSALDEEPFRADGGFARLNRIFDGNMEAILGEHSGGSMAGGSVAKVANGKGNTTRDIVAKLWNLCNVLRDDGITYTDYVTELTFLLFLKMLAETGT